MYLRARIPGTSRIGKRVGLGNESDWETSRIWIRMLTRKVDFEKYLSAICRDGIEARQPRPCRRWSARFLCQNVEMVLQTASLGPNGSKRQVIHHGIDAFTRPMLTRKVDFGKGDALRGALFPGGKRKRGREKSACREKKTESFWVSKIPSFYLRFFLFVFQFFFLRKKSKIHS